MNLLPLLDSAVMRRLLYALVTFIALIVCATTGADEAIVHEKLEQFVEPVLTILDLIFMIGVGHARLTKPTPPITETAAEKLEEWTQQQKQQDGG